MLDEWKELERRFGNTATITNVLLERLQTAVKFGEEDNNNRQPFSDVCADVDSQLDFLSGLGCLNYPAAIPYCRELTTFFSLEIGIAGSPACTEK